MKGFLLVATLCLCTAFAFPTSEATFKDFIKGFLTGIDEKSSVEGLNTCIKDGDAIFAKVKVALDGISKIDIKYLQPGLIALLDVTKEMLAMLKPCSASFSQLNRLESEIGKADINRLIRKAQNSPGAFFHLSMNALEAFMNSNFVSAGSNTGIIEKMLFFTRFEDDAMMNDLVKGLIEATGEKGDITKLASCLKENADAMSLLKDSFDSIRTMQIDDLNKGAKLLVQASTLIFTPLTPCLDGFNIFKRIISELAKADPIKMVRKMQSSPGAFFHLSIDGLEGFRENKYDNVGIAAGTMLKILFVQSTEVDVAFFDFIKGFFEGINENGDIKKIMECMHDGEDIIAKMMKAIDYIMKMEMMKGVELLIEAVRELSIMLKPCTEGFTEFKKLVEAITHANIMKIIAKIMSNPAPIIHDILDCIDMFERGYYENAGRDLGDLLFVIFISK